MPKGEGSAQRSPDPQDPAANYKVWGDWFSPENNRHQDQNNKTRPLKRTPRLGIFVRIAPAHGTQPAFPKPNGQGWDPEDVPNIERPDPDRTTRGLTRKAVIIAKRNSLRQPMIGTVNDEHMNSGTTRAHCR